MHALLSLFYLSLPEHPYHAPAVDPAEPRVKRDRPLRDLRLRPGILLHDEREDALRRCIAEDLIMLA